VPADANALARYVVARLSKKIGWTLKSAELDLTTEAHLADVKKRIDKALEAEYSAHGGSGPRRRMIFFRETERPADDPISVLPVE
jgi:hypothetical protein